MKHTLTSLALALAAASSCLAGADFIYTVDGQANLLLWRTDSRVIPVSGFQVRRVVQPGGQLQPLFVRDIDIRPSNGQLYGVEPSGLYTIDTTTGIATLVGPFGVAIEPGAMDFDPVTDELRVVGLVGNALRNLRINPDTGALISNESGFSQAANPAIPVNVAEIAFTNPVAGAPAGSTRLLATYNGGQQPFIDHYLGEIGSQAGGQASFNTGVVTDIGITVINSFSTPGGLDVSVGGIVYYCYSDGSGLGRTTHLTSLNTVTGQSTYIGRLGSSSAASNTGIAVVPPQPCTADANGDAQVDGADLSLLLATFGQSVKPGEGADFNGDGIVDAADLSVLLAGFGLNCVAP